MNLDDRNSHLDKKLGIADPKQPDDIIAFVEESSTEIVPVEDQPVSTNLHLASVSRFKSVKLYSSLNL